MGQQRVLLRVCGGEWSGGTGRLHRGHTHASHCQGTVDRLQRGPHTIDALHITLVSSRTIILFYTKIATNTQVQSRLLLEVRSVESLTAYNADLKASRDALTKSLEQQQTLLTSTRRDLTEVR